MSSSPEEYELIVKESISVPGECDIYSFISKKTGAKVFQVSRKKENKFFSLLRKTHFDSIIPFEYSFRNYENKEVFKLKKTFSVGRMIVEITDVDNKIIGFLTQPFPTWKTKLLVRDIHGKIMAKISGNLFKWIFKIYDNDKNILAEFYKLHGKLVEELLISTGDYSLKIYNDNLNNNLLGKIIPATIVCIDLFYRKHR